MNETSFRHTITINHSTLEKLKRQGRFGESYSDLISRILNQLEEAKKEKRNDDDW